MAQGVVLGAVTGLLVSGAGLAAVSLALPAPDAAEVDEPTAVVVPEEADGGSEVVADPAEPIQETVEPASPVTTTEVEVTAEAGPETVDDMSIVIAEPETEEPPTEIVVSPATDVADVDETTPDAPPDAPELTIVLPDTPEVEAEEAPTGGRFDAVPSLAADAPSAPEVSDGAPERMAEPEPLPTPTDTAEVAVDAPEQPSLPEGEDAALAAPPAGLAIEVGAVDFQPTARPAMGIVLLDDGDLPDARLVAGLPFPLSVAIDPLAPDAAERMAFWRAAGAEVALAGSLPRAATAQDAAQAIEAWRAAVPWAVAVVEPEPGTLQPDRAALAQLIDDLGESGHGLLVHSRGLNTTRDEAMRDGVPAGVIFRDIDGAGETPEIIRRFLDQAAFRASRNDGVILLGRTDPATIETIRDWSVGKRGQTIAIAPLSVMLPRDE